MYNRKEIVIMKNLSFFKRLKLFFYYIKLIRKNKEEITNKKNKLNLRVDYAFRIYTVLNCDKDVEVYGQQYANKFIQEYIRRVDKLFIDLGLVEYVGLVDIEQLNELDYLIVFGYKGFNSVKFLTRVRNAIFLIIVITAFILLFVI